MPEGLHAAMSLADFAVSNRRDACATRTSRLDAEGKIARNAAMKHASFFQTFRALLLALVALVASKPAAHAASEAAAKPNIVFILCDDLGYGDVRALNSEGKIATPNMDALARDGMIFTDAHGSSAVCSPTRYSLLTGRYNWRTRMQSGVLGGLSPHLIDPSRLTVASLLKKHGYATACIGKWHLGMDWPKKAGDFKPGDNIEKGADGWKVDFSKPIANGPTAAGFDYYFGITASLDMVPYTFIENDRVAVVPTVDKKFPMMFGRAGETTREGPAAAGFEAVDVLPTLTRKAVEYIGARKKSDAPFFLYLPLNAPHTPIAPTREWQEKSGLNPYADFVMETDACIGDVLRAVEKSGAAGNTLFIVTSDNGCSPEAKFSELLAKGHNPSYVFRGTKADIWDGGHHIPFIARWPGKTKAGTHSDALVCLGDLLATCAEIVGEKLPDNAGEDSVSFLPALTGNPDSKGLRETIVHHSVTGRFAIRDKKWKLELCPGSGGWSNPRDPAATKQGLPSVQLYDIEDDIEETKNVQAEHADVVARLTKLLERQVADGRSTPGTPQQNDTKIDIWKKHLDAPGKPKPKKDVGN